MPAAFERTAKYADGWVMGGGTPDMLRDGVEKTRAAWKAAGREGEPRIMSLAYYALGDGAKDAARAYLGDYYSFLGDYVDTIVGSAATDADTVRAYVQGFADAGCDELILLPVRPGPGSGGLAGRRDPVVLEDHRDDVAQRPLLARRLLGVRPRPQQDGVGVVGVQ